MSLEGGGIHSQPEGNPWTKCDFSHDEWEDMLIQVNADIIAHENVIGLEGLAKHGQLWEDWFDAYLDGPIQVRYWCSKKRDKINFITNMATIRQAFRAVVVTAARKARLELAHSTGVVINSSRASSLVPTLNPGASINSTTESSMEKIRKALWALNERKRLCDSLGGKSTVSVGMGIIRKGPGAESSAVVAQRGWLLEAKGDRIDERPIKDEFTHPTRVLNTRKRTRSPYMDETDTKKICATDPNSELLGRRVRSYYTVDNASDWKKASTSKFAWPKKSSNSPQTCRDPITSPKEIQAAAAINSLSSSLNHEEPPTKRRKDSVEVAISQLECSIGSEEAVEEATSITPCDTIVTEKDAMLIALDQSPNDRCSGNPSGQQSGGLVTLEHLSNNLTLSKYPAEEGTKTISNETSEWNMEAAGVQCTQDCQEQQINRDQTLEAIAMGTDIIADGKTKDVTMNSPPQDIPVSNVEINSSAQNSALNDWAQLADMEEPRPCVITGDRDLIIKKPAYDAGTTDGVLEQPTSTSGPIFTFATAIFDLKSGTKSNYILSYASRALSLDEFIIMLHEKHHVDKGMGIMKLRVFIMGDCVEIGVRAKNRDWDWNTAMGVVKERGFKVSVLFEIAGEHDREDMMA